MGRLRTWLAGLSPADRLTVLLGLVVVAVYVLTADTFPDDAGAGAPDAGAVLVLAGASVVVATMARRYPATVALGMVALSVVWYGRYTARWVDLPTVAAFYVVGTTGDRRRELLVAGVTMASLLAGTVADQDLSEANDALTGVGWTVAALAAGELVRGRRLLLAEYAERAERAEAESAAEAERRVAEERLRIARDVHDVLAHTVSVMTVQAGVALDALDRGRGDEPVRAALTDLRAAGKEAMGEVRATVTVLRGGAPAAVAPAPGLARLPDLVAAARTTGLAVDLDLDVDDAEVESLVGLTAYRVVQEALTNVARHAEARRACVRVVRAAGPAPGLAVEVTDDGHGGTGDPPGPAGPTRPAGPAGPAGPGFGLRGMAERVEAVGGTLTWGPAPGGGWRVAAHLPTEGRR